MKKRITVLIFLSITLYSLSFSQTCKVELPALQGSYEGECVKGLAEGQGYARGKDVYAGEFRKGYPHGRGAYQWSTGEKYFGDFKKGLRDGLGIFTYFEDGVTKTVRGEWKADVFIIENIRAAYFVREEFGIYNQRAIRTETGNSIMFYFEQKGLPDKTVNFRKYSISNGEFVDVSDRAFNTMVMFDNVTTFPVTVRIEYTRKSLDNFKDVSCVFDIEIYEPGSWEFHLEHYR